MATDKAREDARVRQQNREDKARQRDATVDLPAPTVTAAIPGYDGLLPAEMLIDSLHVQVPAWVPAPNWPPELSGESLYLVLKDRDTVLWTSTVTGVPLPITQPFIDQFIPPERIPPHGAYQVSYWVVGWNGNTSYSLPEPIIVDLQEPYFQPGSPSTPKAMDLPTTLVDDQYLADHGDEVICQVPYYIDKARGDRVYVYWGPSVPDTVQPIIPFVEVPDNQAVPVEIRIPGTEIRKRQNGTTYVVYWLSDRAGNFSGPSKLSDVEVQLGPLPDNLKKPRIPLDPISRADALEPVEVLIDAFDNSAESVIRVLWGNTPLADHPVNISPSFPLRVVVPWSALIAEYDFTAAPDQPVVVGYQAWRGPVARPVSGPLTKGVTVDLSIIGPPNPDPDPVNPNLPLAELTSSTGVINKLDASNKGADADVRILLHADPVPGEIIDLLWRDKVVDTQVLGSTPAEGDPLDFVIKWADIDAGGNDPRFPLRYTIRAANSPNWQQSEDTSVDVDVVTIDLGLPEFPTIDTTVNIVNCSSLDCGTQSLQLRIPGNNRYLKDGMELIIESQGYESDGLTVVPGTDFRLAYTLTPGESTFGTTVRIAPYDQKLLPIGTGRLKAWYTAPLDSGDVPSATADVRISLIRPGGSTCEVVPCP